MVDTSNKLRFLVRPNQVLALSADMKNITTTHYQNIGEVSPQSLGKNASVASALDNIGHHPSSTKVKGFFHGAGISLIHVGL